MYSVKDTVNKETYIGKDLQQATTSILMFNCFVTKRKVSDFTFKCNLFQNIDAVILLLPYFF